MPGELANLEGRLIEAHRLRFGERPRWNKISGHRGGTEQAARIGIDGLFPTIAGVVDSPFVARSSRREIAEDPTLVVFEEHLHTARLHMVMFGGPGGQATPEAFSRARQSAARMAQQHPGPFAELEVETNRRIDDSGYLHQQSPHLLDLTE